MTLHDPKCNKTRILAWVPKIIGDILRIRYEHSNTLDIKDRQFDYYMPPFGGIKPVCHDRHKTVPEFIVIICDQM